MNSAEPTPRRGRRHWDVSTASTVIFGVVGLIVAVVAWLWPQSPASESPSAGTPATTSAATAAAPTQTGGPAATGGGPVAGSAPATLPASGADYLTGGAVPVQAGQDRLIGVPRKIRGQAAYADHPVVIRCPTNQTGDQSSDVTYELRGHYATFDATVRPYYPPPADPRSTTYVYAVTGIPERDGTLRTAIAGEQLQAGPTAPAAVSADVDGAERLTVRVRCSDPAGMVILTGARLTSAS